VLLGIAAAPNSSFSCEAIFIIKEKYEFIMAESGESKLKF
jgi:hypothetical protein